MLAVAMVVAGYLLLSFVDVCHQSIARGERLRAEQQALSDPVVIVGRLSTRP